MVMCEAKHLREGGGAAACASVLIDSGFAVEHVRRFTTASDVMRQARYRACKGVADKTGNDPLLQIPPQETRGWGLPLLRVSPHRELR